MSLIYEYIKKRQQGSLLDENAEDAFISYQAKDVSENSIKVHITQLVSPKVNVYVIISQEQHNIIKSIVRQGVVCEHTEYTIINNIRRFAKLHFTDMALISVDNDIEVIFCG